MEWRNMQLSSLQYGCGVPQSGDAFMRQAGRA